MKIEIKGLSDTLDEMITKIQEKYQVDHKAAVKILAEIVQQAVQKQRDDVMKGGQQFMEKDNFSDDVLKQLQEKDTLFHTHPFMSTQGGGMDCYNVPCAHLKQLVHAFEILFYSVPEIQVSSRKAVSVHEGGAMQIKPFTVVTLVPLQDVPYVELQMHQVSGEAVFIKPDKEIWEHVRLEVKERRG